MKVENISDKIPYCTPGRKNESMTLLFYGSHGWNSTKITLHKKDVILFISCDHYSMTFKTNVAVLLDPRKEDTKLSIKLSICIIYTAQLILLKMYSTVCTSLGKTYDTVCGQSA